jgi:hypothetical protein
MFVSQSIRCCLERKGFIGCIIGDRNKVESHCLSMKEFRKQLDLCKKECQHLSNSNQQSIEEPIFRNFVYQLKFADH